MTYNQIGKLLKLTPQQVHKIEKEALNKMFVTMLTVKKMNPVEIAYALCETLNIDANQLFKKLNSDHKKSLLTFMEKDLDKNLFNMKKRLKKNQ